MIYQNNHMALMYSNKMEQFDTLSTFIKEGLDEGYHCLYIADENSPDEVLAQFESHGIDVETFLKYNGLSVLSKKDTYCKHGHFSPDKMLNLLQSSIVSSTMEGFKGLRGTGEMTWSLNGKHVNKRLIEYEAKVNHLFSQYAFPAICQYNVNKFPPNILCDIIYTHPVVIFDNIICDNCYYIPPDEFLSGRIDINRMLENIMRLSVNKYEKFLDHVFNEFKSFVSYKKNIMSISDKHSNSIEELLTKREQDVLNLIVDGLTNNEIASKLAISVNTVSTHRNKIMQKLDIRNTAELVKYAVVSDLQKAYFS